MDDSWNRVRTMTYPDGEVVTYHYNAAGQVESMTSNKQGRQSVIVDRIGYDKEGHTVYTKLGNGTETTYTYDKQRERLQVMNLTADGQTVMENRYQYDAVDNILGITNAANPTSLIKLNKAKLGGKSSHTYEYDELNRLVHANGKAKSASYDMVMSFGRMSEPLTKVQKVDSTTTAKSYNFAYKYEDSNHPTAPTQIGNDHYTYDANGNPTLVTNDSTNTTREMYWDEDNRLMVLSDNGKTSRYTYNAAGERIMKSYGTMEAHRREVPTMKGATADPDNTGIGYNSIITDLGDHSVPEGWIQHPKFNGKGDVPGPPIQWSEPESPNNAQPGYGYIANDTTKEETFFYHSDHLGSTSYITDDKANITQYDAYLPYGELLVDEHSSSEDLPYKFNGKQFDEETGLYYYGARYMNPVTSLWYGVDSLAEKYMTIGAYVYCVSNPIRFLDFIGKEPGDFFESMDLAAIDFGKYYNVSSIKENREYATLIYETKDRWGNIAYSYNTPSKGTQNSSKPSTDGLPKDAIVRAIAHTHGEDLANYDNENFSPTDIEAYKNFDGYIVTPKGKLKHYNHKTKEQNIVATKRLPYSLKKGSNGRTKVIGNVYYHKKGFKTATERRVAWYKNKMKESWYDRHISSTLHPIEKVSKQ